MATCSCKGNWEEGIFSFSSLYTTWKHGKRIMEMGWFTQVTRPYHNDPALQNIHKGWLGRPWYLLICSPHFSLCDTLKEKHDHVIPLLQVCLRFCYKLLLPLTLFPLYQFSLSRVLALFIRLFFLPFNPNSWRSVNIYWTNACTNEWMKEYLECCILKEFYLGFLHWMGCLTY